MNQYKHKVLCQKHVDTFDNPRILMVETVVVLEKTIL